MKPLLPISLCLAAWVFNNPTLAECPSNPADCIFYNTPTTWRLKLVSPCSDPQQNPNPFPDLYPIGQGTQTITGLVTGTVTALDVGQTKWQLSLHNDDDPQDACSYAVKEVYFPWIAHHLDSTVNNCSQSAFKLGATQDDDLMLSTFTLGVAEKISSRTIWANMHFRYPGADGAFSPFMIRTDQTQAQLLGAINWDPPTIKPRQVRIHFACNNWALWYDVENIKPDNTALYRHMLVSSDGQPAGSEPWVDVLTDYQTWFRTTRAASDLDIDAANPWLESIHGFLEFGLMNIMDCDLHLVPEIWNQYKTTLPWAQFWGQMSDYPLCPSCPCNQGEGILGECCAQCRVLNPRYLESGEFDLQAFAASVAGEGKHVGFYTAPFFNFQTLYHPELTDPICLKTSHVEASLQWCPWTPDCDTDGDTILDGTTPIGWFTQWNTAATGWGANAHYYDTLGGINWGPPAEIAGLFRDGVLSKDSLSEWPMDIYPTSYLGSGGIYGSPTFYTGGPGQSELDDLWSSPSKIRVRFPALASFFLNDRYFFTGTANDGYYTWGLCRGYWGERQAFLLGHKFETHSPFERMSDCSGGNCPPGVGTNCDAAGSAQYCGTYAPDFATVPGGNPYPKISCTDQALALAIAKRDEHGWWGKYPRYLHRTGLSGIPAGVDVRRFDGGSPVAPLLVVDNWDGVLGYFYFNGIKLPVPAEKLEILEGADLADTDGDGIGNVIDNCPSVANANQYDCDNDGTGDECNDFCSMTFFSSTSLDGYVESTPAATGNVTPLKIGDAKITGNQITYKAILSFDTSALPDAAIVKSTVGQPSSLTVWRNSVTGSPSDLGALRVYGKLGALGSSSSVQNDDYNATATGPFAASLAIPASNGGSSSINFAAGLEAGVINVQGLTQFRLQFTSANDGDVQADQLLIYSGKAPTNKPRLIVKYSAPGIVE